MMSRHSNSLATATAAILVHNENLLRLCTKMAAVSMAKGCMQTLYCDEKCHDPYPTHGRIQGGAEPKGGWGEGLRHWRGGQRGTGLGFHGTPNLIFEELYGIEEIQDMFSGSMASNRGLLS